MTCADETDYSFSVKLVTPTEKLLRENETLIWAGKPSPAQNVRALRIQGAALPAVWAVIAVGGTLVSALSFLPSALGVILIAAAAGAFLLFRVKRSKAIRANTFYAITDKRVIIYKTGKDEKVKSIPFSDIVSIGYNKGDDGCGSLIFSNRDESQSAAGPVPIQKPWQALTGTLPDDGFYDIPDVERVCDIFRNII